MERRSDSAATAPRSPPGGASLPSPHSGGSGAQPMSAALRERLRKSRLSFNSRRGVVKRLRVDSGDGDGALAERPTAPAEENGSECQENSKRVDSASEGSPCLERAVWSAGACEPRAPDAGSCSDPRGDSAHLPPEGLDRERAKLVKQVQEKEDLLRRLKLVKMYRSKNDLSRLQLLTEKWRSCSQLLLHELHAAMSQENKELSLTHLIDHYGLDDALLHYNRNEEEFIGA